MSRAFEWPQWWHDGKLGNRSQLRELVDALHGCALAAERARSEAEWQLGALADKTSYAISAAESRIAQLEAENQRLLSDLCRLAECPSRTTPLGSAR